MDIWDCGIWYYFSFSYHKQDFFYPFFDPGIFKVEINFAFNTADLWRSYI